METNNKPDWYTKEEIYHFLRIKNYSNDIATELSVMWADDLNAAYNKGYQKAMKERDAKISELETELTNIKLYTLSKLESENKALKSELDKAVEIINSIPTIHGYYNGKNVGDFLKDKR